MRGEFERCRGPIGNARAPKNAVALQPTLGVVQGRPDHRRAPVEIEQHGPWNGKVAGAAWGEFDKLAEILSVG